MATLFYVTPTGSDSNIGTTIGAFQNPFVAPAGDSSLNINVLASTFTMNGGTITVN